MKGLYLYFGYAGALPFIALCITAFSVYDPENLKIINTLQMAYASMILSFLAGIHWIVGLQKQDWRQIFFSMAPTVTCLFLMLWGLLFGFTMPLAISAMLFWVIYFMDMQFLPKKAFPEGYFIFRARLTFIVSAVLFLNSLASV